MNRTQEFLYEKEITLANREESIARLRLISDASSKLIKRSTVKEHIYITGPCADVISDYINLRIEQIKE